MRNSIPHYVVYINLFLYESLVLRSTAYLFYYNIGVEKDKYQTAASWLKDSVDTYPVAKIYCDISNCLQNVYKYSKANQTAKLYEEYENLWNEVTVLHDEAENLEDDLKIQVWNEIVNMVNNNCKEFCEVTSKAELTSMMSKIFDESNFIRVKIWRNGFCCF